MENKQNATGAQDKLRKLQEFQKRNRELLQSIKALKKEEGALYTSEDLEKVTAITQEQNTLQDELIAFVCENTGLRKEDIC